MQNIHYIVKLHLHTQYIVLVEEKKLILPLMKQISCQIKTCGSSKKSVAFSDLF